MLTRGGNEMRDYVPCAGMENFVRYYTKGAERVKLARDILCENSIFGGFHL